MANVGTSDPGKTLIGAGNGVSPTFKSIGTNCGLSAHGVVLAEGNNPFVSTGPALSGYVLTSNGLSQDPSFQRPVDLHTAKFIVGDTSNGANYSSISAALAAASSGSTIFLQPGTYTENPTLIAGVNLTAFECDAFTPNVIINGTCTLTGAGSVSIAGIQLQTNSAALLAVTGSAASVVNLNNCYLNCLNNTGITLSSSSGSSQINIMNCRGNIATTAIALFAHSGAGLLSFNNAVITNSGSSVTASTVSGTGTLNYNTSIIASPVSQSSSSIFNPSYSFIQSIGNTTAVTLSGTASGGSSYCGFNSGSASALSIGSGCNWSSYADEFISTNTNAITGSGTLTYGPSYFGGTSSGMNTTTITSQPFGRNGTWTPGIAFGGATTGITYTDQIGTYCQIGNIVYIQCRVSLSSKGSANGAMTLTGLPIAFGSNGVNNYIPVGAYTLTLTASYAVVCAVGINSSTTMNIDASGYLGGGFINVTDAMCSNSSFIRFNGFYFIT